MAYISRTSINVSGRPRTVAGSPLRRLVRVHVADLLRRNASPTLASEGPVLRRQCPTSAPAVPLVDKRPDHQRDQDAAFGYDLARYSVMNHQPEDQEDHQVSHSDQWRSSSPTPHRQESCSRSIPSPVEPPLRRRSARSCSLRLARGEERGSARGCTHEIDATQSLIDVITQLAELGRDPSA